MGCVGCSCSSGGCSTGISLKEYLASVADTPVESLPNQRYDIYEVEFKSGRKEFVRDPYNLVIKKGEHVFIQIDSGTDLGKVSAVGAIAAAKLKQKKIDYASPDLPEITRHASDDETERLAALRERESDVKRFCLSKISELHLEMKYVDAEIRYDEQKITMYFTAEQRVDFRELVKVLAAHFKARIQLTQISPRDEAKRVGGIGSCGRSLCCTTWLPNFENVTTDAAKYQNLPINMVRLNGQCGRLKCCLNYELDTYLSLAKKFPAVDSRLKTDKGNARVEKIDLFKEEVWLFYEADASHIPMALERFNALFVRN
jgi:cell fate regulator YaaT (PSP1 superfamily)